MVRWRGKACALTQLVGAGSAGCVAARIDVETHGYSFFSILLIRRTSAHSKGLGYSVVHREWVPPSVATGWSVVRGIG